MMVEVHCGERIVSDEANKVLQCQILGSAPDQAYCSCLFTYRLLSTPAPNVAGGLSGAALIPVCLSFTISHPWVGESSLGQ